MFLFYHQLLNLGDFGFTFDEALLEYISRLYNFEFTDEMTATRGISAKND